ncbi:hypothetical protein [Blastococcus atacamensis]|uniref:hypothetical protein n=1 Tax=Blastococcus atacamensis TaxID=2070508 RepID=UPI000CEC43DA|nr:hypothetical protein [Blastococcus atacamensis]
MPPRLRKAALLLHVTTSVGWLGAVGAFLALAVTGLASSARATVRGTYVAADVVTDAVIVPLALASLGSDVLQSLGTPWGLVRHYWVVVKLVLTVASTALLLLHSGPIGHLGAVAGSGARLGADLDGMRLQLVVDAAAALLVLLGATALALWKPRGLTRWGRRRSRTTSAIE